MNRRTFLILMGAMAGGLATRSSWPRTAIAAALPIDRTSKWQPNPNPTLAVEWRYVAGRITDDAGDRGFIVALSDTKFPTRAQELLVERQDFGGDKVFATRSYTGALTYTSASATYSFQDAQSQASASWQWDDGAQVYRLSVTSPELTLQDIVLRPQGDLIPEGGDGTIAIAPILGFPIGSDYYADWAAVEVGGVAKGVARVDLQGLYLASARDARRLGSAAPASPDYDHHWFAIAGQLDGAPAWISAWRIEATDGPRWDVTIARGAGATWQVASTTEQTGAAFPLAVWPTDWQPLPASVAGAGAQRTGRAWHLTAGISQPGDLIDMEIAVPPGQFASGARLGLIQGLEWVEEGVGTSASGTVLGQPLDGVALAVAETTAEFYLQQLPLALR